MFTKSQIKMKAFNPAHLVLILGHNRETRLLMKTLLELWNYRIIEGRNIQHAAGKLLNQSPSTIIFDADSSFSDSLSDLRDIRRNELFKTVPVIVISSYAAPEYRKLTLAGGATDFFTKPLNYSQLEVSLRRCSAPDNTSEGDFL